MKGSGKQVLLQILYDLSTHAQAEGQLETASRRLRAGLLLHGSTADESYESAARLRWATELDEFGDLLQGVATQSGVFVSDLLEAMFEMPGLRGHLLQRHPALAPEEIDASEWFIWLIVTAVQFYGSLNAVEVEDGIDINAWVEMILRHYDGHFGGWEDGGDR